MLNNEFKKSAIEKLKSMDSNEFKKAFKEIGSEPETNEEWFCQLSTEEKAEWITDKINAKLRMALHDAELYPDDINENEYMENEDEWEKWLKQPHQGE